MVHFDVESVVESEESELLTMVNMGLKSTFPQSHNEESCHKARIIHSACFWLHSPFSELHGLGYASITLYTTTHRTW